MIDESCFLVLPLLATLRLGRVHFLRVRHPQLFRLTGKARYGSNSPAGLTGLCDAGQYGIGEIPFRKKMPADHQIGGVGDGKPPVSAGKSDADAP